MNNGCLFFPYMTEALADSEVTDDISDEGSDEVEIILADGWRRVDDEGEVDGDIILARDIAVEHTEFESVNKLVDKLDQAVLENWHQTDKFKGNGTTIVSYLKNQRLESNSKLLFWSRELQNLR